MSNIPKAREELENLARSGGLSPGQAIRLRAIIRQYLWREGPVRRAPDKSPAITPAMKGRIKAMAKANPAWHVSEIAAALGINPGRVSEVLNGKR